jgi:GR25 family glycosyltransferase involved in LPS biosynthesis
MIFKDCNTLIIHSSNSTDRQIYIDNITKVYPNIEVIEAVTEKDLLDDNKTFYYANFKRRHNMKMPKLYAKVGCFLSHMKCYKYIIDNKIDNVIIFEDDIIIKEPDFIYENIDNNKDIIYLGYKIYKGNKTDQVIQTHAIYYKSYKLIEEIYNYAQIHNTKWKAFDLWLDKYILPNYNVGFHKYIRQVSGNGKIKSLID